MKNKDLKERFIEKGIVMSKCGKNAVFIKRKSSNIVKINLRDVNIIS